jgi:hypothetical protein
MRADICGEFAQLSFLPRYFSDHQLRFQHQQPTVQYILYTYFLSKRRRQAFKSQSLFFIITIKLQKYNTTQQFKNEIDFLCLARPTNFFSFIKNVYN